jgi:hypothetical protein
LRTGSSSVPGTGRSFQYYHLHRAVHRGQVVVAERRVLGRVTAKRGRVHLAEIDHGQAHNPLDYGHLEPYSDRTTPTPTGLYLDGRVPRPVGSEPVGAHAQLVVAAADTAPQRALAPYTGLRPAPALVEWRLLHGTVHTSWQVVADFRKTEASPRDFWKVYAPGTYRNNPIFDHRLYGRTPGRYPFHVRLDRSRLRTGWYQLEVRSPPTPAGTPRLPRGGSGSPTAELRADGTRSRRTPARATSGLTEPRA